VEGHNEVVRREFAAQAASFEDARYTFADQRIMDWILSNLPLAPHLAVLDVAAGTGHLGRAIAPFVRQVVASDLTPEMLATGKAAAEEAAISNVIFERGDAAALPHLDGSFDLVVNRFAVHHFEDPGRPVAEMVRVCRPGGHVAIVDLVTTDDELAGRQNELERMRDPSHTRALDAAELAALLQAAGATVERETARDEQLDVERWLTQSNTPADAAERIRNTLAEELAGGPATGMRPVQDDDRLRLTQRWAILVAAA
jgi:ubiquinone/menaquinone biosynthesis C-methylase UbiE